MIAVKSSSDSARAVDRLKPVGRPIATGRARLYHDRVMLDDLPRAPVGDRVGSGVSAWEAVPAASRLTGDEVLARLDWPTYLRLAGQRHPDGSDAVLGMLETERLASADGSGRWHVSNLGAILFARRLDDFSSSLARKAIRFVAYGGRTRTSTVVSRRDFGAGYANAMEGLADYLAAVLPSQERIVGAFRRNFPSYHPAAVREVVANALLHQDMTITGAGPTIELFSDRLEVVSPGVPLIDPERFLDSPARSRNEALASLARRMGLCEEQGAGIDRVVECAEALLSPPPNIRIEDWAVRVTLFAPRRFADTTREERIRACYQHASLKFVGGERMGNRTLRERFGIASKNAAQVSAVIKRTVEAGLIRPADPDHPRAGYVPFWA